jgi:hypothetical protein
MKVVRSYVRHTADLLEKIRGVKRETLFEYATIVHGIKGSSLSICADKVGGMAEELERAAKSGDFETVSSLNVEFINTARRLIDNLRGLKDLSENSGPLKTDMKSAPESELLERILEYSRRFNTSGMEEVISEIDRYTYESSGDLVEWLKEKIENLDYDEITERLEKMLRYPAAT